MSRPVTSSLCCLVPLLYYLFIYHFIEKAHCGSFYSHLRFKLSNCAFFLVFYFQRICIKVTAAESAQITNLMNFTSQDNILWGYKSYWMYIASYSFKHRSSSIDISNCVYYFKNNLVCSKGKGRFRFPLTALKCQLFYDVCKDFEGQAGKRGEVWAWSKPLGLKDQAWENHTCAWD